MNEPGRERSRASSEGPDREPGAPEDAHPKADLTKEVPAAEQKANLTKDGQGTSAPEGTPDAAEAEPSPGRVDVSKDAQIAPGQPVSRRTALVGGGVMALALSTTLGSSLISRRRSSSAQPPQPQQPQAPQQPTTLVIPLGDERQRFDLVLRSDGAMGTSVPGGVDVVIIDPVTGEVYDQASWTSIRGNAGDTNVAIRASVNGELSISPNTATLRRHDQQLTYSVVPTPERPSLVRPKPTKTARLGL